MKLIYFITGTQNVSISNGSAQKVYLGWNDEQIKVNREWLRKDASLQHEIGKIQEGGSDWNSGGAGAPDLGASVDQGEDTPPEFGPAPGGEPETGGEPEATAPEPPPEA